MTEDKVGGPGEDEFVRYMRDWSKRYLGRVRAIVHTIAMIRSEIDGLAEQLDGVKGVDYASSRVSGAASDNAMVERIARYSELREELQDELDRNLQAQADAHRALSRVRQPWRAVLTYRYLEGLPWVDVAERLGSDDDGKHIYSVEYIRKEMHDNGLVELYPYIPHEYDELPGAL